MAKKSRRKRVRLSPAQMVQPEMDEVADASPSTASARPASKVPDLGEEYRYVIADLKRIGVIAAVMLVVLTGLALLVT
jgi:hypothetical protein